ncbi:hypothetical protein BLNAU_11583 [Blattamonas nauphoetae]|uniref:MRG domain-containing protein n=1 Tax=Blattamonas nauphoetae TaxID=2049346 RepID=A0ABQ9XNX0_9EUKA|nr:hypothetical protein BLNAU_11583 [Blattamonas nauphoetae]
MFNLRDYVFAKHKYKYYRAQIVKIKIEQDTASYLVHYPGWSKSYDVWRSESELMPINPDTTIFVEKLLSGKARMSDKQLLTHPLPSIITPAAPDHSHIKVEHLIADKSASPFESSSKSVRNNEFEPQSSTDTPFAYLFPKNLLLFIGMEPIRLGCSNEVYFLPRSPSIALLIKVFLGTVPEPKRHLWESTLEKVTISFCHYCKALPYSTAERHQLSQIMADHQPVLPQTTSTDQPEGMEEPNQPPDPTQLLFLAEIYGVEHLVRFLWKLPEILENEDLLFFSRAKVRVCLNGLLEFINIYRTTLFVDSLVLASNEEG